MPVGAFSQLRVRFKNKSVGGLLKSDKYREVLLLAFSVLKYVWKGVSEISVILLKVKKQF